jgi:hypothetical protein
MVRRVITLLTVALVMVAMMVVFVGPASAQGGGCKAFGENVAGLAQSNGSGFGQAASGNAPLNDTVEAEQQANCG